MLEIRKTFCRVCHAACPVLVDIEDGHTVVGVRGDRDDPVFGGYTCIKGRQLADQHHDPDRLRSSLRRTDGGFEPIASADALDDIAARIRAIRSIRRRRRGRRERGDPGASGWAAIAARARAPAISDPARDRLSS